MAKAVKKKNDPRAFRSIDWSKRGRKNGGTRKVVKLIADHNQDTDTFLLVGKRRLRKGQQDSIGKTAGGSRIRIKNPARGGG